MNKQQIIDYIMHTPSNTNPAMLGQFLDEYSGGSGESWSTLFEGEIATEENGGLYVANLSISDYIDADKIKVTFNGVEYECNKTKMGNTNAYGGSVNETNEFDFSNYPFMINSINTPNIMNAVATESPGTYSIKIEVPQESGGSGDWSAAEVTFINHTVVSGTVRCASVEDCIFITDVIIPNANSKMNPPYRTIICPIPLYKNQYELSFLDFSEDFNGIERTISGNIVEGEGVYLITGDCTITLGQNK